MVGALQCNWPREAVDVHHIIVRKSGAKDAFLVKLLRKSVEKGEDLSDGAFGPLMRKDYSSVRSYGQDFETCATRIY
ncbi:hypothetical protein GBA52_023110 [Prunus armeniaca]|nr:hypothetical protein GBA52_023110 [Prunus armeniaca]